MYVWSGVASRPHCANKEKVARLCILLLCSGGTGIDFPLRTLGLGHFSSVTSKG